MKSVSQTAHVFVGLFKEGHLSTDFLLEAAAYHGVAPEDFSSWAKAVVAEVMERDAERLLALYRERA